MAPRTHSRSDALPTDLVGGRFQLVEPIGEGAMATVYRAYDQHLKVYRAIKRLSPAMIRHEKARARFASEAQLLALMEHPNIVRIFDVLLEEGCIVMELVEGGSLVDRLLRDGPMPPEEAVRTTIGTLRALEAAHERGVVHRDIKPHNILLTAAGETKVTDFGVARLIHRSDDSITKTGATMGTWAFMAPEQRADAKSADGRADIYSTGATLYALLTAETPRDLFAAEIDPALLIHIPPALRAVIKKATSYRREDRYPHPQSMIDALRAAETAGLGGGTIVPMPVEPLSSTATHAAPRPRILRPGQLSPAEAQPHRPVAIAIDRPGVISPISIRGANEDTELPDEEPPWVTPEPGAATARLFLICMVIGAVIGGVIWSMTRSEAPLEEVSVDGVVPSLLEPVADEPVAEEPAAAAPEVVSEPVTAPERSATRTVPAVVSEPVAEPVVAEAPTPPAAAVEPVAVEPVAAEPAAVEPAEPAAAEPAAVEPAAPTAAEPAAEEIHAEIPDEDFNPRITPAEEPAVDEDFNPRIAPGAESPAVGEESVEEIAAEEVEPTEAAPTPEGGAVTE
ncbi:MAG: serine/threonine-protein kinase [Myxococcota bacterium]|nr:serine/threonine-protein kinase [Myxococcota bacterium]